MEPDFCCDLYSKLTFLLVLFQSNTSTHTPFVVSNFGILSTSIGAQTGSSSTTLFCNDMPLLDVSAMEGPVNRLLLHNENASPSVLESCSKFLFCFEFPSVKWWLVFVTLQHISYISRAGIPRRWYDLWSTLSPFGHNPPHLWPVNDTVFSKQCLFPYGFARATCWSQTSDRTW